LPQDLFKLVADTDKYRAVRCVRFIRQGLGMQGSALCKRLAPIFAQSQWLHTLQLSRCNLPTEIAIELANVYANSTVLKMQ